MTDKEKSSKKVEEKPDKKCDNKKKYKETTLVTSTGTPTALVSIVEIVHPDSNDDILLSSQTQQKIHPYATAYYTYHKFIQNYEPIMTVGDNIPMEEIGRTQYGLFEFLVIPFGLTNAAATCQCFVNNTLQEFLDVFCVCYLNDILIYLDNLQDYRKLGKTVLKKLHVARLFVKPEKSEFKANKITFLGFVIT